MQSPEIIFDEIPGKGGNLAVITLNRPKVLNSLNHNMVNALHAQLKLWADMPTIKAVIVRAAEGRAFCAGGDLRHMYERFCAHDPEIAAFFYDEYQLNRYIFHYPKPYIALLDGITMGGGVGISQHGSHRITTEHYVFAMPETAIGFFPDVGGTYFLPRITHHMGYYLGLTGERILADESVRLRIATHKVMHQQLNEMIDVLANTLFSADAKQAVSNIIANFQSPIAATELETQQTLIDACFNNQTIEDIIAALQKVNSLFSQRTLDQLSKKSPTSLKITLRALQAGELLDFDACMRQEYRLVSHFLQNHDFIEGIRALIIDKDQKPNWQPKELSEVSEASIIQYFTPLQTELS